MMAETVHGLPLLMRKACHEPKVAERMVFHVDKVVGDSE